MGVNQRAQIKMTDEEIDEFLHGRHSMSCATIGPTGDIHMVAMWYGFLDGCVAMETKAKSQKVQNLRRSPRITCMVEDGEKYEKLRGVELVGSAEIIDDPDRLFEIGVSVWERYQGPYSDEAKPLVEMMLNKRVGIKVNVDRIVSWDHRKLGIGR
jgi:PPOX class probable F420-dependent enzyme